MKMAIHSVSSKVAKDAYLAQIKSFTARAAVAKKSLLFSGSSSSTPGPSSSAQARQQTQEAKAQASLAMLKQTRQQLHETEAVGIDTVNHLAAQSDQIKKTKGNVEEVNANLSHSNKLLNKMNQWFRG
jgi:hypothetical protein